jgi:periplasmic protein TonB
MAQTLAMRATALAGSAALLTLATMAALSVSYTVQRLIEREPGAVEILVEPEPPPPPVAPPIRQAPPLEATAPVVAADAAAPADAPPTETALPVGQGPVTIESPRWLERPRNLARYYPRRAVTRGMEGEAVLDCLVSTAGALRCAVVSETPASWGFGEAALRIAHDHRMAPASRNGEPVEGRYRMRVPFQLD